MQSPRFSGESSVLSKRDQRILFSEVTFNYKWKTCLLSMHGISIIYAIQMNDCDYKNSIHFYQSIAHLYLLIDVITLFVNYLTMFHTSGDSGSSLL